MASTGSPTAACHRFSPECSESSFALGCGSESTAHALFHRKHWESAVEGAVVMSKALPTRKEHCDELHCPRVYARRGRCDRLGLQHLSWAQTATGRSEPSNAAVTRHVRL